MNHIFKTISKKLKGRANTTVVVSENASSLTKTCDDRSAMNNSDTHSITLSSTIKQTLNLSLALFIFASSTLQADIIADTNAPTNTQPIILNTQSGATQVNIQTPTSSGISINNYSQFDTGANGTILNNSRTNVNTVTAGWVEGNPFLATGSATAIVNQVNSSNPSNLTGNIEIAGSKADFILANPSGISIDGVNLINASHTTLTTGTPIIESGALNGFSVNDGTITVQGAGLNALGSDYTNILARSAIINAGIWANELSIITGVNTVSRDSSSITAGNGATPAPLFAIDSSALGGMYAGKINLIGTEAGVGVNNAGVIGANENISIDINGNLTNSGTITSRGDISATTKDIINTNSISASKEVKLQSTNIDNTDGEISAGRLDISATNLNNTTGNITQTGIQDLAVNATNLTNDNDGLIGYEPIDSSGSIDSNTTTGGGSTGGGTSGGSTGGGTSGGGSTTPAITLSTGNINITDTLLNDNGKLIANGATSLNTTNTLTNSATIDVENLNASGSSLENDGGTINANNINISTTDILNTSSKIQSNSKTTIESSSLSGDGEIISNGDINMDISNSYTNTMKINGLNVDIDVIGELTNNGEITSANTTSIDTTDSITNRGLIDGYITSLTATNSINNIGEGRIYGDYVSLQADTINNTKENDKSAVIGAREELNIGANIINNIDGATMLSMGDVYIGGSLDENGFAIGKAKEINNLSATIESGGNMSLASDEINNKTLTQAVKSVNILNSDIIIFDEKYSQLLNGSIKTSYVVSDADVKSITSSLLNQYIQDGKTQQITISLEDSLDGYVLLNGKQYPIVNNPNIRYIRSSGSDKIYIIPNDIEAFISEATMALNEKYSKFDIEVHYTIPTPISQWVTFYEPDSGYRVDLSLYSEEKQREYSDITTEEYFSSLPTNPSLISSGSNLNISANNVTNYLSTILSAGDMKFDITGTLENKSEVLYRYNETSGRFQYCYKECNDMFHSPNYTWAPLGITQSSAEQISSLNSSIIAGGSITGNFGSIQNGMEANVPFTHQSSSVSENDTNGFTTGTPNTSLPNSALFLTNPDNPDYFIQTDPRFTNYKNFISSDYMLSQLSLDPTTLHKRLGDGYYEQKLIREQIMSLTGKRFLEGFNSDEEQYMALLNSGVEYMKSFDISVGIALSSEQMKNLTTDIVLLVQKEVTLSDGTKTTALVPQLYTAASKVTTNGSLIAANSINVNVASNVTNSGKIYSDTTMDIKAGSFTNNQGDVSANNALAITTTNDIQNLSGSIKGSSVNLTATNGSIINKTLTQDMIVAHDVGDEHYTITGQKATITATGDTNNPELVSESIDETSNQVQDENNGNVILSAGKNIENSGADITATNSISLKAGDKIIIDTATNETSHDFKLKNGYMKGESTINIASNISANQNITMSSTNDTIIKGSNINALNDVNINAGGNLVVLSALDSDYETSKFTVKGFLSKKITIDENLEQSVVGSSISGNNVSLSGEKDVVLQATTIKADDNVDITSKSGDVIMMGAHATDMSYHEEEKNSLGSLLKKQAIDNLEKDEVYSAFIDASNVTIKSENGDTILNGSQIQAEVVNITADTLMLISDVESTSQTSFSDDSGILTRTIIDQGDIEESAVASTINAKEIMLNGKSLLEEKLDKEKLFETISSEYNLNDEQIIQVKAILNSKEWYDKTTTMSQLGSIIVAAIVTVCTAGAGAGFVGAIGGISNATVSTAVAASIDAMVVNATTQIVSGVITGDMNLDFNAMIKSAALAGAFSVVTTTIDTQMGYNKIDPTTGERVVLSYGDKISQQVLHGLAQEAIYGGDIETIMANSVGNVAFEYVGHELYDNNPDFPIPKTVTHALIGGTLSELAGGDFSQGAISTAVGHVVSTTLDEKYTLDIALGNISIEDAKLQIATISKAVGGAISLATHENVSDKELELALDMAYSVAYNNAGKGIAEKANSLTSEEKKALFLIKNMTPEEKEKFIQEQIDLTLSFSPLGIRNVAGKAAGSLLEGIALKLEVPVTKLLERLGLSGTKVVVNTLDDAKSIVSSTATQAGRVGKDFKVASEEELNALYQSLTKDAVSTEIKIIKNEPATIKFLDDGTRVLYRESTTGGKTIEVQTVGGKTNMTVHIMP